MGRTLERRGHGAGRRVLACAALASGLLMACGLGGDEAVSLEEESILHAAIPGTSNGRIAAGPDGKVTKLLDVPGDWTRVSVALVGIVQDEGWTVTALNCVGTGNDVIAKKQVGGEWLLLESGAGGRGAGVIVSRDPVQAAPGRLTVSGRCPDALVRAVD